MKDEERRRDAAAAHGPGPTRGRHCAPGSSPPLLPSVNRSPYLNREVTAQVTQLLRAAIPRRRDAGRTRRK